MILKSFQKMIQNEGILELLEGSWRLLGPSWRLLGRSWEQLGPHRRILRDLGGLLGHLETKKVANMLPTWLSKWRLKHVKFEAKIDQFFNPSWACIYKRFWWILEAKWRQVAIQIAWKIDANFEKRFLAETSFFIRKNHDFEGSGHGS